MTANRRGRPDLGRFAREIDVPPRPLDVARRLAARPGVAFLWSADGEGPSYVASDPIQQSSDLDPDPELAHLAAPFGDVPRWIGVLPYEAFRSLERPSWRERADTHAPRHFAVPCWQRYDAVARIGERVHVVGDSSTAVAALCERLREPPVPAAEVACRALPSADTDAAHALRIQRALELIRAGDLYQVNLARRLDYALSGHPLDVLEAMVRRAPGAYSGWIATKFGDVVTTSPELLLAFDPNGRLRTSPIKGTRPRGRHSGESRALRQELASSAKEEAELTMVIDVERSDLGRISLAGSVRLSQPPRVDLLSGVFHRHATITSQARPGLTRDVALRAMLPSGSVTGAPKVRAMEVIADLEASPRGLYTGGVGALTRDGSLRLGMAIRTLVLREGIGEYFVGGGIVADSAPDDEVMETRWKAAQMASLGVPDDVTSQARR